MFEMLLRAPVQFTTLLNRPGHFRVKGASLVAGAMPRVALVDLDSQVWIVQVIASLCVALDVPSVLPVNLTSRLPRL